MNQQDYEAHKKALLVPRRMEAGCSLGRTHPRPKNKAGAASAGAG